MTGCITQVRGPKFSSAISALVAFSVVAGCFAPDSQSDRQRESQVVTYDVLDGESRAVGSVTFRIIADQGYRFVDSAGRPTDVVGISVTVTMAGYPSEMVTLLSLPNLAHDLGRVAGCPILDLSNCDETLEVEWFRGKPPTAFFGAGAIPRLEPHGPNQLKLETGDETIFIDVTKSHGAQRHLHPLVDPDAERHLAMCNILDDDSTIDIERQIVLGCFSRDSELSFHLQSPEAAQNPRQAVAAESSAPSPFAPLEDPIGPLPPGAEFELEPGALDLQEAFDAALRLSSSFREYLDTHPEANLANAGRVSEGESSVGPGLIGTKMETYEASFVANNAAGFEWAVQRNIHAGAATEYALISEKQTESRLAGGGDLVLSPKPMVRPATVSEWFAGLGVSADTTGFVVIDTGETDAARASYDYFFAFTPDCSASPCRATEHIQFSGSGNILVSANLSPAALSGFLKPL